MRVVNQQVPTPFRDVDVGTLLRPNLLEFAWKGLRLPLHAARPAAPHGQPGRPALGHGHRARPGRGAAVGHLLGQRHRALRAPGALRPRPHRRLPPARVRALPRRHRPRHLRAHHLRRRGLGRRAHLLRRGRVDGAAHGLQAGRDQGPRAGRRRDRLDHEHRHRGRGGGEVPRRGQPAGAVRQRVRQADPDAVRLARAPGQRHGLPPDRLPDVQAPGLPAPARGRPPVGGASTPAWTSC